MSDALIQSLIRAAESSTPDQGLEVKVIAPATPKPDANEQAYIDLRSRLVGKPRKRIEQEYRLWLAAKEKLSELKQIFNSLHIPGEDLSEIERKAYGILNTSPSKWRLCDKCKGLGDGEIGYCRNCKGEGYFV